MLTYCNETNDHRINSLSIWYIIIYILATAQIQTCLQQLELYFLCILCTKMQFIMCNSILNPWKGGTLGIKTQYFYLFPFSWFIINVHLSETYLVLQKHRPLFILVKNNSLMMNKPSPWNISRQNWSQSAWSHDMLLNLCSYKDSIKIMLRICWNLVLSNILLPLRKSNI